MKNEKAIYMIAMLLVLLGALNWGTIGLFNFNLVNTVFSELPSLENAVYVLVGVSALYIGFHPNTRK